MDCGTHISRRVRLAVVMGLALVAAGCLDVADERARFDAKVGQAANTAGSVEVSGGLAAVRQLTEGELTLWAQAPTLEFRVAPASAGTWNVHLRNVMKDGALTAIADDGTELPVRRTASPVPTESTWQVAMLGPATFRYTPPDAERTGPWKFVVYADVQRCIDHVQDLYDAMNADPGIRFALISGDLTPNGAPDELDRFQRELRSLQVPAYATLGNHELGTGKFHFHRRYGRGSFSFAHRGARFTLMDSASATISPIADRWLDDWLDEGADAAHLFVTHIPPLDPAGDRNGAFASRAEAHRLVAKLAEHGVDLTIYGHVHTYEEYANAGIRAIISGGGGAIPQRLDEIGRHFLVIEVNPATQAFQTEVVRVYPEFL